MRDARFEAAFLRDAILVGLVHERHVPEWAAELLCTDADFSAPLAEVLSVPVQLSPVRDALRAFGEPSRPLDVTIALLSFAALDSTHRRHGAAHILRLLSDIRRLAGCPPDWARAIVDFEAKALLAAGVPPSSPLASEILQWLDEARPPVHFLVSFSGRHDAAMFVAALARAMTSGGAGGRATLARGASDGWTIGLDEAAWVVARRCLDALPVAGIVPHPGTVPGRTLIDGISGEALSAEEIGARLSAIEEQ